MFVLNATGTIPTTPYCHTLPPQVGLPIEGEAHHGVAALQEGMEDGHVRLGAGMGLDVGVLGPEQRLRAVAGQILGPVDNLATAVVTTAREIGRAPVRPPVTNAHLVCRLLLEKKTYTAYYY